MPIIANDLQGYEDSLLPISRLREVLYACDSREEALELIEFIHHTLLNIVEYRYEIGAE